MQTLNQNQIDDVFQKLKNNISSDHHKAILSLDDIRPPMHEIAGLEWRYRLSGYAEGLCAADILDSEIYEKIVSVLFGPRPKEQNNRPGRKYEYSVDIKTERNKVFSFDVPSINPFDAYVQLTKRIAYKTIPGIISVLVYAGFQSERLPTSTPLKSFSQDEFIYVSL